MQLAANSTSVKINPHFTLTAKIVKRVKKTDMLLWLEYLHICTTKYLKHINNLFYRMYVDISLSKKLKNKN